MFKCETCGEIEMVLLDGYSFGDRLLEDVMFEITKEGDKFTAKISKECEDYFEDLNKEKWLKEAEKYASTNDIFTCPKCGGDV